ncbi:MAG: flagellar protein [Campylobacterota bacterium]|nr:flagellar protein [Campylobacterota bacterium]
MLKWILFALLSTNLFALEISMDSAKDNFSRYSSLHLSDKKEFVCQEMKDDFLVVTEIICAFSKRPSQEIKKLQNDFFKVDTFIQKDTFFITIKPFYKIKLTADIFDLSKENSVYEADVVKSNSWIILGYRDKLPLINNRKRPDISLNLPFYMDKDKLPYVGSLDIKGNPVHIKKVGDVKDYLKVKKYYKEKKYELCMDVADDILQEYPNTLFKAELIYYKIKLYAKLKDYDNVISNAKDFFKDYSASDNIPEVLALVAQAYAEVGINIDADYFFDRLFSEHPDSVFTQWGYIYKGEMLEASGGTSEALKFYKKALYGTADIDVAATAAFNIANLRQSKSVSDATKYVDKILKAKPSYFGEKYKESKTMMYLFKEEEAYDTAANIAKALLDSIDPTYDDYEILLSERALWLAETKNKLIALEALNKYLKQFPDGDYLDKVQSAKDALFFETSELNTTAKLAEYDKLIEEYPNDSIGNRAIYEKAKLMLASGMDIQVLDFKDDIFDLDAETYADKDEIIKNAAVGVMKNSLKNKECNEVLIVSREYNITLSDEWDDDLYECAMKGGDYQLSKSTCSRNLKSDDLEQRKKWLYRYIKVDFATGNYSDVIDASKDLIALIEDDKNSKYIDVYRYIFDTYNRLEKKDEMIQAMSKIEQQFGLDSKDIERYISVMSIGSEQNDDNIVIDYGKKVMDIQERTNGTAQSPYVEFTLYQSYITKENYTQALEVISALDKIDLSKSERARQKYFKGATLDKLWRNGEANKAYQEAIDADANSAWAKLALSAQEI